MFVLQNLYLLTEKTSKRLQNIITGGRQKEKEVQFAERSPNGCCGERWTNVK